MEESPTNSSKHPSKTTPDLIRNTSFSLKEANNRFQFFFKRQIMEHDLCRPLYSIRIMVGTTQMIVFGTWSHKTHFCFAELLSPKLFSRGSNSVELKGFSWATESQSSFRLIPMVDLKIDRK